MFTEGGDPLSAAQRNSAIWSELLMHGAKTKSATKMLAVQRIFRSNATGPFSPFRT